ncbi:hypothetical protein DXG01_017249 [Tephrocybe rancida]|nr:hypothetical protein DXG01_017249 [Tephrocybe rancida]
MLSSDSSSPTFVQFLTRGPAEPHGLLVNLWEVKTTTVTTTSTGRTHAKSKQRVREKNFALTAAHPPSVHISLNRAHVSPDRAKPEPASPSDDTLSSPSVVPSSSTSNVPAAPPAAVSSLSSDTVSPPASQGLTPGPSLPHPDDLKCPATAPKKFYVITCGCQCGIFTEWYKVDRLAKKFGGAWVGLPTWEDALLYYRSAWDDQAVELLG